MWYQITAFTFTVTIARDGLLPFGGNGARADVDRHRPLDTERDDPVQAGPRRPFPGTNATGTVAHGQLGHC
jgi:hypothetical protein